MRFTSLVIELIRARPRLVVWIVVLVQAALWLLVTLPFYHAPPSNLALALAYGREYQVGSELGPPLSFWLADLAYRAAGNHMTGVYLLAELCDVATFWILFLLGRALVGGQHAVLAVLLTMTVTAFGAHTLEFGPDVLARPLWALLLLHSWELIGQRRRNVWFAWSIDVGLLLLTTSSAIMLLVLALGFALATKEGRRPLRSFDPLFALLVVVVLALPYLIFLLRADSPSLHWPMLADLKPRAIHWAWLIGALVLAITGILLLVVLNAGWFSREGEDSPIIYRPPVPPLARDFVYFFALAPAIAGSFLAALFNLDHVVGGTGVVLSMSGLAVVVAAGDLIHLRRQRLLRAVWAAIIVAPAIAVVGSTLFLPWTSAKEIATSLPSRAIGAFFTDAFERRTNHRLAAVAGDAEIASLVALGAGRPHLFLDANPKASPWIDQAKFNETGGVVVWRASDTAGTPPAEIARHFPGLVPEVPRSFDRLVNGRQPTLRIGWAIVRPKGP
ncbi:MAG TPA: glycosyltransferase family 39 protein [Bradyrhizobium sp.]|nr:glycosyltransferase family 39 protein [Bradyrhizobium sp.]